MIPGERSEVDDREADDKGADDRKADDREIYEDGVANNRWTAAPLVGDRQPVRPETEPTEQPIDPAVPAAGPTGRWRTFEPLRERQYRRLIIAVALSIFGHGMLAVTIVLQTITLSPSPTSVSLVGTALALGLVITALPGGVIADRIPQRTVLLGVETVNVVAVVAIAVLGFSGALAVWHLVAAAALLGAGSGFFYPAYSALLPRLLPPEQLLAANGIEGTLRPTLQMAIGPAIAGIIGGTWMPTIGLVIIAILFTIGLMVLCTVHPPADTRTTPTDGEVSASASMLADMRAGFVFMLTTPWLLWTLVFAAIFVLAIMGPIEVLLPFVARETFADGERMYGFLVAAFGLGGALGALVVSASRMPRRYLTVMMAGWGLGCLPLAVVGVSTSFPLMWAALFVVGFAGSASTVIWGTLLQRRVPREMLGRVSSLDFFVSLCLMPVSIALAGPLSEVIPISWIFVGAGVVPAFAMVLAIYAARMTHDELEHPLDDR